ncbi:hypothetical protein [Roseateles sp. BYS87W]|uniref:Uncharacterized protein n=1 Tax=Pelomonas baiyunensis TaxID=3299026 RepID=A0ABW7GZK7_9BURK
MQRRSLLVWLAAAACAQVQAPAQAQAASRLPPVTLLVELRWVEQPLTGAAKAGVRDGAFVVGTGGTVSPRGAGVTVSSAPTAEPRVLHQLRVLNGQQARAQLISREPLQTVETVYDVAPDGKVRGAFAKPQTTERRSTQSFNVQATWVGEDTQVRVSFSVQDDRTALESTLDLPPGQWVTVARTGEAAPDAAPKGTLSSQDAARHTERELQLRVTVLP